MANFTTTNELTYETTEQLDIVVNNKTYNKHQVKLIVQFKLQLERLVIETIDSATLLV